MTVSAQRARRWRQILFELRPALPGEWSVRGTGLGMSLVREPLDWALGWIGYSGSPSRPVGWAAAGVQPLVTPPLGFGLTYGIRMDEVRSGPRTVDLLADDAADAIRRFVLDAGLAEIDAWPVERLAEVAERDFAQDPHRRGKHWDHLPGWRVVTGSGSPVEPAEQLTALCRQKAGTASGRGSRRLAERGTFYERLCEEWHEGGSGAALRLLAEQRDQALGSWKLDRLATAPRPDPGP
ncbi:hypothetical protein [Plantactinospora sp. BB1]|uniref:hypothetical protein n=1 Tax=Plantactinospora sp. BB1 TaxID=2071627 RepID=UPI000D1530E5|nr:hypothetical protein [Plantactinospora sp. BB1]AVT36554.1 hypothetical protein C6W10_08765 [Plantactinospora sp. BB1]